jgi:hypothetical protein
MEGAFREAHDWVNNMGVGVLANDRHVTFEEAVRKQFTYYYDLVDVMSERASARPKASTNTMRMTGPNNNDDDDDNDNDSCSSTSSPSLSKSDRDDDGVEDKDDDAAPAPAPEEEEEEEEDGFPSPTFASPASPIDKVPTILASASPIGAEVVEVIQV